VDPIGTIGSLGIGYGTEKVLTWAGVDADLAGSFGQLASQAFSLGRLGKAARLDPVGTSISLGAATATEIGARLGGADPQTSNLIGGAVGAAAGLGLASFRASRMPRVGDLLRASRGGLDLAALEAAGLEFEMSKGLQIDEGVTLFRRMPAEALSAQPAGAAPDMLEAPASGGASSTGKRGYSVGDVRPVVPYEDIGTRHVSDVAMTGAFEPRSRLIGSMSNGTGTVSGGPVDVPAPAAPAPVAPAPAPQLSTRLAPPFLETAIVRSGVTNFVYRSIAQDAEQLAQWNLAVRRVAARPNSVYATTLGGPLTYREASDAFFEINREFFDIRGIAGLGEYNVHHWNPRRLFPELAVDPRNLYLVDTAIEEGRRVGEHIFVHRVSNEGNPYRGTPRPGAIQDLGFSRSVIQPLDDVNRLPDLSSYPSYP
jgi:hypothetical protein